MSKRSLVLPEFEPVAFVGQEGKPSLGAPHNAAFPTKDVTLRIKNAPPSGIFPSNLLKDRSILLRCRRVAKESGITPERLLHDRFKTVILISWLNDWGMLPSNELLERSRTLSIWRSIKELGMLPDS